MHILRIARSKAQQTARCCANEYGIELSEAIQTAAITGNTREMYGGIKKALGSTLHKTAPLRSSTGEVVTDKGQQLDRWVEYYTDLYSRKNSVILSPGCCRVLADHGRATYRANFGGAQQGHQRLGLWQGPWQRRHSPTPNQALQDHLTKFIAM